ncbi:MAG TPA: molybdenum cofactor guanylyltransferase, partial [Gaiellales bacterium]|nr:molybdenum cofactor guanylyltransferase [Gaiellales bacterium]
MGTPKALLDWHGSTLVERVAGLLARVAAPVVIVAAPGQELPDVPGAETAVDASPGRGPLEGIAAGLRALQGRCDRAFVAATDLPLMHPAFVSAVLDALQGEAAAPASDGRVHPLAAAYRVSRLDLAEHLLAAGELRASALAQGAGTRALPAAELPHPESLRNVNTPDDYRTLLALPEPMVVVDGATWRA